jgi:hypothetical protein
MIRSPQHRKKGTQMPGLFAGEEGDEEKVEALVEYLSTQKAALPAMPKGDEAKGKVLYHKSAAWPATSLRRMCGHRKCPDDEIEKPGNGSVPIALADAYDQTRWPPFCMIL